MDEATTIIGSTITVNGDFESGENVAVQGRVQGRIETTADLLVEETGVIEAEVITRNIDVQGTISGNVTASDRLEIHPGGRMTGDVRAHRVILTDGCKFKGHIDMDVQ